MFDVTINEDSGNVFVDAGPVTTVADKAFVHTYEHPNYYSYVYSDVLVIGYQTADEYPVLRTWVEYNGTKALAPYAVTFHFENRDYTFSVEEDYVSTETDEAGLNESIMIKYGASNLDMILALEALAETLSVNDVMAYEWRMTIHGAEESITVNMPGTVLADLLLAYNAMGLMNGLEYLDRAIDPCPLTVK